MTTTPDPQKSEIEFDPHGLDFAHNGIPLFNPPLLCRFGRHDWDTWALGRFCWRCLLVEEHD